GRPCAAGRTAAAAPPGRGRAAGRAAPAARRRSAGPTRPGRAPGRIREGADGTGPAPLASLGPSKRETTKDTKNTKKKSEQNFFRVFRVFRGLSLKLKRQPVVRQLDAPRQAAVGLLVLQVVAHVREVGAPRPQPVDDVQRLVQAEVGRVR